MTLELQRSGSDARLAETAVTSSRSDSIVWASPEPRLWVATYGGDYVGRVEFAAGHFTGFDRLGAVIGTSGDLPIAREMVSSAFGNGHHGTLDVPDSPEALTAAGHFRSRLTRRL